MATSDPTREPTLQTLEPSPSPTNVPTMPTVSHTLSATFESHLCRDSSTDAWDVWKRCYFIAMYPFDDQISEYSIALKPDSSMNDTYFEHRLELTFAPFGKECLNPSVSVNYANIPADQSKEYLQIFDHCRV